MAEPQNMTEGQPKPDQGKHKTTVEEVRQFLEGRGRLLDLSLQKTFASQTDRYDLLKSDIDSMNVWKRKLPFLEVDKKSNLRTTEENIKYAFEVIGRYSEMFENTESLPRVATEMAKWGAEELIFPVLADKKKGSTLGDREAVFKERRTVWFSGLERMMRAAEAWRMLLSVNGKVSKKEANTRALTGGEEEKIEFVSKIYEFMDESKGKTFEDFTALLDGHFVPDNLIPEERRKRLSKVKGDIRRADGYGEVEVMAAKIAGEIGDSTEQPMFYEYMWMVVTGKTDRYTNLFADRLKAVGRRESAENPDLFTPRLWVGVANDIDVKEGHAVNVGKLMKADLSELSENGELKPWFERKLREMRADAYLDDKNEGSIWLAMEVDLSKVLGSESGFGDYVRKIGAIDKPLVTISIPVSVNEAKVLALEFADPDKVNLLRDSIVDAYTNRLAGLAMSHGFGADERVYLTPSWAQAAFNAAEPERGVNLVTEQSIKEKSLGSLLSGRVCGVVVNVLGGKGSGIDTDVTELFQNTAGSMERASWYELEIMRAMTLLPDEEDERATIAYTHSMGGQTGLRLSILLPESNRGKVHIIAATPVSTINPRINTFMHGNLKNKLGNTVIQTRYNRHKPIAAVGRTMAKIGKAAKIDQSIINDMIIPLDAENIGSDKRECNAMISVHGEIYETEDAYVARQRGNLEASNFAFAQYSIDDLRLTAAVKGGSETTVLIGLYDEVLDPSVQVANFRENPQVYAMHNFSGKNWQENFDGWINRQGVPNSEGNTVFDQQVQVVVGNFGHYLNVSKTGRYFMNAVLKNLLKRHQNSKLKN